MTSGNPNSLPIYPDYCQLLSPTIGKWCPLRAIDVHSLHSVGMFDGGREIFHHGNHPIKFVRVTGVIVAMDEFNTRRIYTIDDSSGMCIECTCPTPPSSEILAPIHIPGHLNQGPSTSSKQKANQTAPKETATTSAMPTTAEPIVPWDDLDVGVVVKIKGKPGQFRDMKQVEIVKAEVIRSTEAEVKCWNETLQFRQTILNVPWVVSKEEEDKLRRKAEKQFSRGKGKEKCKEECEEKRKKRKETERRRAKHEESTKRRGEKERSRELMNPANRVNFPSLAMRKRLAEKGKGKYDALGL